MKILSLLFLLWSFSGGLLIAAEEATAPAVLVEAPPASTKTVDPLEEPKLAPLIVDAKTQEPLDFKWLFIKTIFSMLVVLALMVLIFRYLVPRLSMYGPRNNQTSVKVISRTPLDTKKALYVVEVEEKRLLIATSENYVGLLQELEKTETDIIES